VRWRPSPPRAETGPLHRERGAVGLEKADERVGRRAARQVAVDVDMRRCQRQVLRVVFDARASCTVREDR
jgi:hypothetical protein